MRKYLVMVLTAGFYFVAFGCGSSSVTGYKVGGKALGLDEGDNLVLQMNLKSNVVLTNDSAFIFSTPVGDKNLYHVSVQTAPAGKTCAVANGDGYISGANVTNVDVMCGTDTYTVGGTAYGLALGSSLVLQNNRTDDLTVAGNGTFAFATALPDDAYYDVTILTNSTGKTCEVTNNKNIINGANVTDVVVVCNSASFNIGGTVTGIPAGKELLLQNNLRDDLTLSADGTFTFATKVPQTGGYHVSVLKEPSGTNCTVANGTGVVGGADVTDVAVTCVASPALMLFLSSHSVWSGDIGGVDGADAYCDRDPSCPQLGTCKALIVDDMTRVACSTPNCSVGGIHEHLDWVLQPNRTYTMTDKTTVIGTTNDNGVFDFPFTNAISSSDKYVWTGLLYDWTTGNHCQEWDTKSYSEYGNLGWSDSVDNIAIYSAGASTNTCRYSRGYLYCVEQPD